jgi:MoaD family protein
LKVRTLYFARLRELTGREAEELDVPEGSRCIDVVRAIAERYGEDLRHYLFDESGSLRRSFAIALNGERTSPEAEVREGDTVVVIPPISGGRSAPEAPEQVHVQRPGEPVDVDEEYYGDRYDRSSYAQREKHEPHPKRVDAEAARGRIGD